MTAATIPGLTAIEQAIVGVAQAAGVDPRLALATASLESGFNPTAVGDGGTSYGLFQLHQGGELGNLTPQQAFQPVTNAQVALGVIAQAQAANPGGDPGAIAAAAQRPADPAAYAAAVDSIYANPAFLPQVPASASLTSISLPPGVAALNPFGPVGVAATAVGGSLLSGLSTSVGKDALQIGLTIVFTLAGLGLIALGLSRLFPGVATAITIPAKL